MIAVFENEFVSRKKWLDTDEFLDMVAIAESTPGPIAINTATYIGYKREKILGAVISTLGMVLPSFIVIYVISLFFNQFMQIEFVAKAFKGIQVCVVFLILNAGIKLFKKLEKSPFNIILFSVTVALMVIFNLFAVNFSSIFYILISAVLGLTIYLIRNKNAKGGKK